MEKVFTARGIYGFLKPKLLECGDWRLPVVHPQLIICLAISIVAGFTAAGIAVCSGWSLFWVLPIYSSVGSVTLLATTLCAHLAVETFATSKPRLAQPEPSNA